MTVLEKIQEELSSHHSYQTEFHDAVMEVLEDVVSSDAYEEEEITQLFKRLIEPDRTLRFKVEWQDDQGVTQVNRGWRVQFNNALGVYKGGLRFHPTCKESIFKFLGFEQIFKNALTGLPMGGAKGGSDFDPKGKSRAEVQRFCQAYMNELHKYIGADIDVPAGDIGVGTKEIGYLYGHYLKLTQVNNGVLTGKHPSFGGSCGREEATGFGVIYLLELALKAHSKELKGQKILISGSGNVALHAAQKAIELGGDVISVSDSGGTLYYPEGLNLEELEDLKLFKLEKKKRLKDWKSQKKSDYYEAQTPWHLKADIAIPCATQNEIGLEDIQKLKKNNIQVIAEGANMPLSAEAQDFVQKNKIIFLPGKAANSGGVAVSGLERTQNSANLSWDLEAVDHKLKEIMANIHEHCSNHVERVDGIIPYKKGANLYSFSKLKKTMQFLWP